MRLRSETPAAAGPPFGATAAHLALLWSLAVAQPLYDALGRHVELFVARQSPPGHVWGLVALLSLALPAALIVVVALARRLGGPVGERLVDLAVVALAATAALPVARKLGEAPALALPLALLVGVAVAVGRRRLSVLRSFLTAFSPAALVFPLVFLLATPIAKVVFPRRTAYFGDRAIGWGPIPVVVLVFDLFPLTSILDAEGGIDGERFPGHARLAGMSTWFRQARTVAPHTTAAVPALLTGRTAVPRAMPVVEDYPDNLFTWLGPRSRLRVFESMTELCPPSLAAASGERSAPRFGELVADLRIVYLHLLLPPALRVGLPAVDRGWYGFGQLGAASEPAGEAEDEGEVERLAGKARVERQRQMKKAANRLRREDREAKVERFLAALPSRAERSLTYLHVSLPHTPLIYLPSGRRIVDVDEADARAFWDVPGEARSPGDPRWSDDVDLVLLAYRRHLLQTAFTDRVLGRILDRLEAQGILESALVVVAADHGRTYLPGGLRRSMEDGETLHVPLFVKVPYQRRGVIDDREVDLRDVVPTIGAVLGLAPPWEVEGRPLLDAERLARATAPGATAEVEADRRPLAEWPSPLLVEALRRRLAWAPPGPIDDVYAAGPLPELYGRRLETLAEAGIERRERPAGVVARLLRPGRLERVEPESGVVPAYLPGELELPSDAGAGPFDLALALDGTIRATARSFRVGDSTRFAFLVPEQALTQGSHRWVIFLAERGVGEDGVSQGRADVISLTEVGRGGKRPAKKGP